jgi:DNA processing protein
MASAPCLQRGLLLRELSPRLARTVDRGRGRQARDLLALDDRDLCSAAGVELEQLLRAGGGREARSRALAAELAALDCWAACPHGPDWPAGLATLEDSAPRALFGRGDRELLGALAERPTVTVIGARRAGAYGIEVARSLGRELAAAGLVVLSGMAFGIDSAAHQGALEAGGLTVAVLGSGPDRAYPRARARLYEGIVGQGLVLSELPPLTPTFRWMFPARNRLMAALAELTVVVEAAERSGSLITAEMAADCGRPVGAVPGPVTSWRSAGANMLLADGAAVIRDAQDVLDRLLGPGVSTTPRPGPALSSVEEEALERIEAGAVREDEIVRAGGLGAGSVAEATAGLELAGYLEVDHAGCLQRTTLEAPDATAGSG